MPPLTTSPLPRTFTAKKARILAELAIPETQYLDKSPKGSVDAGIRDLIAEINGVEGLVTTSSCAGRVSVFVEGAKATASGGKGGGKWLFVSHEPVGEGAERSEVMELFGLVGSIAATTGDLKGVPRLIRLSFEPLILHVLCASLVHAKPLLAAAISAGFRESGVQSLKSLEDVEACPMIAVRSAGMGFETVIGFVKEDVEARKEEVYEALVSEEYLGMMMQVVNGRFIENELRRERFREELRRSMAGQTGIGGVGGNECNSTWEDAEARRARKREEGLRKQQERRANDEGKPDDEEDNMNEGIGGQLLS